MEDIDINQSIIEVASKLNWKDPNLSVSYPGCYNSSKFSQVGSFFGNSCLKDITAGESDWAFNTLLKDTELAQFYPDIHIIFMKHLIKTIDNILDNISDKNKLFYRKEYTRFMIERDQYRTVDNTGYISRYNSIVIDTMLS